MLVNEEVFSGSESESTAKLPQTLMLLSFKLDNMQVHVKRGERCEELTEYSTAFRFSEQVSRTLAEKAAEQSEIRRASRMKNNY